MTTDSFTFETDNFELEGQAISAEAIWLRPEQVDQAQAAARQVQDPSKLWNVYLNSLARQAFEIWLKKRLPQHTPKRLEPIESSQNSWSLDVNGFQICLLPQGSQPDEFILIPQDKVDSPTQNSTPSPNQGVHFFVLVAIAEEQGCVEICAILRHDKLIQNRALLSRDEENHYQVPFHWFNPEPEDLLLYLRCAEPAAFSLEPVPSQPDPSQPDLIQPNLREKVVNTALWLEGKLDAIAQTLAWTLLPAPPLESASAFRNRAGGMQELPEDSNYYRLIRELRDRHIPIPATVRPAYQDFAIAKQNVRLYALSWSLELPEEQIAEWILVLIVGPTPGIAFPKDIGLIVEDQNQILLNTQLDDPERDQYLFAEVIGEFDEVFQVKLQLSDQVLPVVPAFTFQPHHS